MARFLITVSEQRDGSIGEADTFRADSKFLFDECTTDSSAGIEAFPAVESAKPGKAIVGFLLSGPFPRRTDKAF